MTNPSTQTQGADELTKEEFIARFKAELIRIVGPTYVQSECNDSFSTETFESTADYADETAPTYWDEPDHRADGPEECACIDFSYWGD